MKKFSFLFSPKIWFYFPLFTPTFFSKREMRAKAFLNSRRPISLSVSDFLATSKPFFIALFNSYTALNFFYIEEDDRTRKKNYKNNRARSSRSGKHRRLQKC